MIFAEALVVLKFFKPVKQVEWHVKGDYFAMVRGSQPVCPDPPAVQAEIPDSLQQGQGPRPDRPLPPGEAVPVRGHPEARPGLQPGQAGAGQEADDGVQVDLQPGHSPWRRQRPRRHLRQEGPVVRPRPLHLTLPGMVIS